jgi:serine-type D-Ala-D-Ala carboxypeptidase (penicillin-binding protein 5/6)
VPSAPLTRKQVYRRRRIVVFGGLALVLATAFYLPITLLAPVQAAEPAVQTAPVPATVAPPVTLPGYGAAAVGAVGYPGLLTSSGSPDPLPIASITKVVTALVVLSAKPLGPDDPGPGIEFGDADLGFYDRLLGEGGVVADVSAGQVMAQRNVMEVMLLESANNYAESLANWAFGSLDAYVAAANVWLDEHGFAQTSVVDATGMSPSDVSSVSDLVALGELAIADPVVSAIVSRTSIDIPGYGVVENRNGLLGVDGVDGIKTGTLDESGACLLFAQDHVVAGETITLVGVVLGGPDHDTINGAIRQLLAEVDAGFAPVTLTAAGQVFATYATDWGDAAAAVPTQAVTVAVWGGAPVSASVEVRPVTLAEAGTDVGAVTFSFAERTVSVPLELDATIDDPGAWWRLTNPAELF